MVRRPWATVATLTSLAAALVPGWAAAAEAPVWVPSSTTGDLFVTRDPRAQFVLPGAYEPTMPADGGFSCRVESGKASSRSLVSLTALASVRNIPVRLRRGRVEPRDGAFRVTHRGREGALRWYAGRRGFATIAVAYERAPDIPRLNGRRFVSYRVEATVLRAMPRHSPCRRAAQGETVRRAIRSMRLVDATGEPLSPNGTPRAVATVPAPRPRTAAGEGAGAAGST